MPLVATRESGSTVVTKEFELREVVSRGVAAVDSGDTVNGLQILEQMLEHFSDNPVLCSYYAVCIAQQRQQFDEAFQLCGEALEMEPLRNVHHLNLGRVYLASGAKKEAIRAFRNGLLYGRSDLIQSELNALGWRKPPVIQALPRENPLNVFLGRLVARLGLR